MLRVFRRFLTECCAVPVERLTFSVNCFVDNGLPPPEIEAWWLDVLEPRARACAPAR